MEDFRSPPFTCWLLRQNSRRFPRRSLRLCPGHHTRPHAHRRLRDRAGALNALHHLPALQHKHNKVTVTHRDHPPAQQTL